jgi:pSer/pThr/pTyr-binding forkhead associated (FHA) protein
MQTVIIGREPDTDQPRIILPHQSVSRRHATVTALGGGTYMISDAGSRGGTFVYRGGTWAQITSANVGLSDRVRFGTVAATLGEFLARVVGAAPRRVERNPETGEIVSATR